MEPAVKTDPLADLVIGDRVDEGEHWALWDGAECTARRSTLAPAENDWDAGGGVCSRKHHPPSWRHIAHDGRFVIGIWGGEEAHGEPESDVAPVTGEFRRLRNNTDVLFILDQEPRDDKIQVLDLSHTSPNDKGVELPRVRSLTAARLMPPSERVTGDHLRLISLWWADRRRVEREVAIGELATGRLSPTSLTEILERTNLAPYIPTWTARAELSVDLKVVGIRRPRMGKEFSEFWADLKKFAESRAAPGLTVTMSEEVPAVFWSRQ